MSLDFYPLSYRLGLLYCSLIFFYGSSIIFGLNWSLSTLILLIWNLFLVSYSAIKFTKGKMLKGKKIMGKYLYLIILAMSFGIINGSIYRFRSRIHCHNLKGYFLIDHIDHGYGRIRILYKKGFRKALISLVVNKNILQTLENHGGFHGEIRVYPNKISPHNYYGSIKKIYSISPINKIQQLRLYISERIHRTFPKNYGLVIGLLLGEKRYLKKDSTLSAMGLAHLTAVSGLHMNAVFNGCFFSLRIILIFWPMIGHWIAYLFALMALFFLLVLSNFSPSATRSFIMQSLYIMAKIFHLPHEKFIIWCIVFFLMTILDGSLVESPSFLMSFFAVLALYLSSSNPLKGHTINSILNKQILINSFLVPLSVTFFHSFNCLSLLWNVLFLNIFSYLVLGSIISCFIPPLGKILDSFLTLFMYLLYLLNTFAIPLKFVNLKQWNKIILFVFLPLLLAIYTQSSLNLMSISLLTVGFLLFHWTIGYLFHIYI